ncbi:MAG: hypothetical protein KAI83_00660 [Thiomargarita sp.]|nr:hypothetical protein [Thiomargarita sp.]
MNDENGLKILGVLAKQADTQTSGEFDLYKGQLLDILDKAKKHILPLDVIEANRNRVIHEGLNPIADRLAGKSFVDLCQESAQHAYKFSTPDHFDLDDIILECEGILWEKCGLVGLGVHSTSSLFLNHFQTRLKKTLGRDKVFASSALLFLNPLDVESSLKDCIRLIRKHKFKLCHQDVLLKVLVPNEEVAIRFWQKVVDELNSQFDNRFIIIIAMGKGLSFPQNVITLPPPDFEKKHIISWVRTIVDKLLLPMNEKQNMTKTWVNTMMMDCSEENKLHVDLIYEHVADALEKLNSNSSLPTLHNFLEERKLCLDTALTPKPFFP